MGGTLETIATVPSGASLDITVYEDTDNDGTAENTITQSIGDGTNSYDLGSLDASSGNDVWLAVSMTPGSAATLDSATMTETVTKTESVSIGSTVNFSLATTIDFNQVSGTVTLNGSAVQGATIRVIDQNTDSQIASTTTDSNGDYAITVDSGLTVHVTVEYEDGNGNKYNDESKPFVTT